MKALTDHSSKNARFTFVDVHSHIHKHSTDRKHTPFPTRILRSIHVYSTYAKPYKNKRASACPPPPTQTTSNNCLPGRHDSPPLKLQLERRASPGQLAQPLPSWPPSVFCRFSLPRRAGHPRRGASRPPSLGGGPPLLLPPVRDVTKE